MIDKLENLVLSLSNFIDRIIDNPLTELTPVESVLESYHSPFVDDNTINWLCNNIDELYQSDGIDYLFSLDGINYLTNKISSSVITINTDIYENQIIHGFIDALIYRLSELISGLNFAGNTANISNKNLNIIYFF